MIVIRPKRIAQLLGLHWACRGFGFALGPTEIKVELNLSLDLPFILLNDRLERSVFIAARGLGSRCRPERLPLKLGSSYHDHCYEPDEERGQEEASGERPLPTTLLLAVVHRSASFRESVL